MRLEDFVGDDGAAQRARLPRRMWHAGRPRCCRVTYRFDPGAADDGVTVHVPLAALNQVEPTGFDWQVPGLRDELVDALLRSLPKEHRRELVPMAEVVAKVVAALRHADGVGGRHLAGRRAVDRVNDVAGVARAAAARSTLGRCRRTCASRFSVDDEHGTPGRHRQGHRRAAQAGRAAGARRHRPRGADRRAQGHHRVGLRRSARRWWRPTRGGVTVRGYPALLDDGDSVSIRVLTKPELQAKVMRSGVRRLLLLAVPVGKRAIERDLTNPAKLAVAGAPVTIARRAWSSTA